MAIEVISQILSPTNATYINGVSAERRFSAAVLKNSYQKLIEKDGTGVTDKFVSEDDAESSAQVFVNRVLPNKMKPREQGANKNGASFSANSHYVQTETVGIEILQVLDDPIYIPRARQDMIKVDLLAEETEIFSNRLATILNGVTAAAHLLANFEDSTRNAKTITSTDVTNKVVLNKFVEANGLLDEGDEAHGIDIFPEDTRVAVFKVGYRATLKTSGILVLGGANYAYDIAKGSGINAGVNATKNEDGYIGDIDGVACHVISNESLGHAADFCGFPTGEFKYSDFIGYICSSYACARGVSASKRIKIVDAQAGQGLVVQPYVKFGCKHWYPKGVVALSTDNYNPIADLKTLFSSVASSIVFKLKGAGSRLFPTLTNATTAAKLTSTIKAEDDFNEKHVKGAAYVVGTAKYTTVGAFLKAYNTNGAKKGTITITDGQASAVETSYASNLSSGDVVTVLAIADDGSISLDSVTYTA